MSSAAETWPGGSGLPAPVGPFLCPEPSAEGPQRESLSKQQFPHNHHGSLNINTVHLLVRECAQPGEHRDSSQPPYNPRGAPSELPTSTRAWCFLQMMFVQVQIPALSLTGWVTLGMLLDFLSRKRAKRR